MICKARHWFCPAEWEDYTFKNDWTKRCSVSWAILNIRPKWQYGDSAPTIIDEIIQFFSDIALLTKQFLVMIFSIKQPGFYVNARAHYLWYYTHSPTHSFSWVYKEFFNEQTHCWYKFEECQKCGRKKYLKPLS